MAPTNPVNVVVREWVEKAESDFWAARQLIKAGQACGADIVCFHAQQCVEKYLKSLLVAHELAVPKTHDLTHLMEKLPKTAAIRLNPLEQDRLTSYAVESRYPEFGVPIEALDARVALKMARRVRTDVRRLLPRPTLRRK